ncbi:HalOD1 output domain-containing protein [Natronoarchaeum mannanilyticum]|uniref:Halobacterial output domain-containing protein n=1 Tax=Natronoarchaeum mannanilyticum TaxID=926360 RepID=A0AAV3TC93_9EURY
MSDGSDDRDTGRRFTFDPDEQPSTVVTEAVAEVRDLEQDELPPLYDAIDGDRLDDVVRSDDPLPAGEPVRVRFRYAGCEITVTSHGAITVSEVDSDDDR